MQLAGITPILTHPERNPTLQKDTARLTDWLRNGMLVQVTAGSVLGHMGKAAEQDEPPTSSPTAGSTSSPPTPTTPPTAPHACAQPATS